MATLVAGTTAMGVAHAQPAACPPGGPCPVFACSAPPNGPAWPFADPRAAYPCAAAPPTCYMQRLRIWDSYRRQWVLWTNRVCE